MYLQRVTHAEGCMLSGRVRNIHRGVHIVFVHEV